MHNNYRSELLRSRDGVPTKIADIITLNYSVSRREPFYTLGSPMPYHEAISQTVDGDFTIHDVPWPYLSERLHIKVYTEEYTVVLYEVRVTTRMASPSMIQCKFVASDVIVQKNESEPINNQEALRLLHKQGE